MTSFNNREAKHRSCWPPTGSSTFDKHCERYSSIDEAIAALSSAFENVGLDGVPEELVGITFLSQEETSRSDLRASIRASVVEIHRRQAYGDLTASEAKTMLTEQTEEILEQRKIARRAVIEKIKGFVGEKESLRLI